MKRLLLLGLIATVLIAGCTQPTGQAVPESQQQTIPQVKTYGVGDTITKDDISIKLVDINIDIDKDGKISMDAQIHAKENTYNRHLEYTNAASFLCEIYDPKTKKRFPSPQMIIDFGQTEWDYLCVFFTTDDEFDNFIKDVDYPIYIIYSTHKTRDLIEEGSGIEPIKSLTETYVFSYQPDVSSLPITQSIEPSEPSVDENIMALWHFDEGSGTTVRDSSSYGNDGALYGNPTWKSGIDCKFGNCLQFDGINDYIYVGRIDITESITLEAWVYRKSNDNGTIICKNGPYELSIADNKVKGGVYAGSPPSWTKVYGKTILQLDIWYHLAMTYDGSNVKVYVNGQLDDSTPKNGLMPSVSQPVMLGYGEYGCDNHFNGIMDEVIISSFSKESFNV